MLVGIEQLRLHPYRHNRVIPTIPGWMVDQIKRYGQFTPVVVYRDSPSTYTILKNCEVWVAVQHAGLLNVEISIREDINSDSALEIIDALNRVDPVAEANSYQSQLRYGGEHGAKQSISQLALKLHVNRSTISHSLRLLSLSTDIKHALSVGSLSVGHAKILLTIQDEGKREKMAKLAISRSWSVRMMRKEIKSQKHKSLSTNRKTQKSPDTISLEKRLSDTIGCQVEIDQTTGKLIIDYYGNLDVLDGVIGRISSV